MIYQYNLSLSLSHCFKEEEHFYCGRWKLKKSKYGAERKLNIAG